MGVIKRQGIKNTITGYLGITIGFVNLLIVQPHFLTKEELGLTRLLYGFSVLVATFVPLGIGNATVKYFPLFKDREKRHHGYFGFMNLFPLAGFLLAALVLWIFKDFILNQYRHESPMFLDFFNYVFPLIFFNAFISILSIYCNSNFKSTIPAFLNDVVVRILTICLVSVYFLKWIALNQFIAAFTGIYAFQVVVLLLYILVFDRPGLKIDWKVFREKRMFDLIRYGLLLWFAGVASIGLKYFDSIMIGKFMPLEYVGIYTVAAFIPTVIEAPLYAFDKIAAARIAFAWAENKRDEINAIYHKSSLYMFLTGGLLFLLINLNIHTLLTFLPQGYQQGEWVVMIISLGTLFNMATGFNTAILFNSDKYRFGAVFLVSLAVIILLLQMLLIPLLGLKGAALATAGASFIYNGMLFISVWKFFGLQPFNGKNLKVLLSIVLCFAGVWFIPHVGNPYLDIFIRASLSGILYFCLIYFQKIVPEFHSYLPWGNRNSNR